MSTLVGPGVIRGGRPVDQPRQPLGKSASDTGRSLSRLTRRSASPLQRIATDSNTRAQRATTARPRGQKAPPTHRRDGPGTAVVSLLSRGSQVRVGHTTSLPRLRRQAPRPATRTYPSSPCRSRKCARTNDVSARSHVAASRSHKRCTCSLVRCRRGISRYCP